MLTPTLLALLAVSFFLGRDGNQNSLGAVEAFSHPSTFVIAASQRIRPLMAVAPDAASSEERLKEDIAALKEQAASRLESLLVQMEELKELNSSNQQQLQQVTTTAAATPSVVVEPEITASKKKEAVAAKSSVKTSTRDQKKQKTKQTTTQQAPHEMTHAPASLLDDTVWKIVFNVGRETGTWMPPDWGASGDRLLFQCTVHFTGQPETAGQHDEFFHASLLDNSQDDDRVRTLAVTDAFVIPRGVGAHSVGRRPLPVQPTGAYKICRGQGPAGTDIVRLYIELTESVTLPDHESDVYCPAGRVYGTCGYFAVPTQHRADEAPTQREQAQAQHQEALREWERLQQVAADLENDANSQHKGIFSLDHWQKQRELWRAKQRVESNAVQLQTAKQQEPEKAQLRLTKTGDVGLSREGGVCCKVHKGLALEYHILGRMEVGCVEDHHHHASSL